MLMVTTQGSAREPDSGYHIRYLLVVFVAKFFANYKGALSLIFVLSYFIFRKLNQMILPIV